MEKYLTKDRFLCFITPFIVCVLLGYLSHDLMNGIRIGISVGIGAVLAKELGRRREKRKQEEKEKNAIGKK